MLIAPAGYGKTTLAEQWVVRDGRVGVWFTARSSSTDVAALALGIARAATKLIDDCDHRLREHLRALPAPAENVQTLAEILSEDLAAWPENAWLVLDDYHEVTPEPKAEDFIEALVALSPVQFLIASRVRPRWVASKDIMYGAVLEVGRSSLAMDNAEAASVLVGRTARAASGLASLANGWPAVIGLASASSADIDGNEEQVPGSLYRFFADEVFAALDAETQQGLTTLALAPVLDEDLARALLGSSADLICSAAVDVGLLVRRELRLDLHPLARVFLEERTAQLGLAPAEGAAADLPGHVSRSSRVGRRVRSDPPYRLDRAARAFDVAWYSMSCSTRRGFPRSANGASMHRAAASMPRSSPWPVPRLRCEAVDTSKRLRTLKLPQVNRGLSFEHFAALDVLRTSRRENRKRCVFTSARSESRLRSRRFRTRSGGS